MKKGTIWLVLLALTLTFAGCGGEKATNPQGTTSPTELGGDAWNVEFAVPSPMAYPTYTFDHTPTTDELRQMAVQAMADELTVQWCVDKFYSYRKTGSISDKAWSHAPTVVYSGLPYSNGDGGLIQMMEFYDTETGTVSLPGNMNDYLGNSCAGSVCAAWNTVCDSLYGYQSTMVMTPKNGYIPVGPYVSDSVVTSFAEHPTDLICQENGEQVMYASYAQMLPADALTSNADDHAIMAIEPAHVVCKADGTIDPDASYIAIQDQRGGENKIFYKIEEDGTTVHRSGRIYAEYTFAELYKLGYLPVTAAEFIGQKEYTKPQVSFSIPDAQSLSQLLGGTITSNYPLCVVRLVVTDENGQRQAVERFILDKYDIEKGTARSFPLNLLETNQDPAQLETLLESGKTYTLSLEAAISNGENVTLAEFTVEGE